MAETACLLEPIATIFFASKIHHCWRIFLDLFGLGQDPGISNGVARISPKKSISVGSKIIVCHRPKILAYTGPSISPFFLFVLAPYVFQHFGGDQE